MSGSSWSPFVSVYPAAEPPFAGLIRVTIMRFEADVRAMPRWHPRRWWRLRTVAQLYRSLEQLEDALARRALRRREAELLGRTDRQK